jgi:GR25 family glycosyltransferase involved in LPS biosynthesis
MKGFNNFDVLYYINLEHRTDRKEHLLSELANTDIDAAKIKRIDAIYMKDFGELGCSLSHIKALESFLEQPEDVQHCLILEDDFMFRDRKHNDQQTSSYLNTFFKMNIEYDVLMIAGNVIHAQFTNLSFVIKIEEVQTTSAYCVHRKYAPTLLNNFREGAKRLQETGHKMHELCLDQHWKTLQRDDKWFAIYPLIGQQMMSYSDIEKKVVDYGQYS